MSEDDEIEHCPTCNGAWFLVKLRRGSLTIICINCGLESERFV